MIRILITLGNTLLTLASIVTLSRKAKFFGQSFKRNYRPQYTRKR